MATRMETTALDVRSSTIRYNFE
uniref:Uncharacterized protein n=1 Tax=Anguilla anguilla TaxID=7936 RepID=A0A0E9PUU3_ANGAN